MNHRYAHRAISLVVAGACSLLGVLLFAPSAFATLLPAAGGGSAPVVSPPHLVPVVVRHVVAGGMAGWQIALITCGVGIFTAALAVLGDRVRAASRRPSVA